MKNERIRSVYSCKKFSVEFVAYVYASIGCTGETRLETLVVVVVVVVNGVKNAVVGLRLLTMGRNEVKSVVVALENDCSLARRFCI